MSQSTSGFTIVELLIVIVMIAILASIVIVNYNGVTMNARNASRSSEVSEWHKLFELYNATYGSYPPIASGSYCLGRNFPIGPDDQRRCRNYNSTDPTLSYLESNDSALMTEILKVGSIPTNAPPGINGNFAGPWVAYWGTGMSIWEFFEGSPGDCPKYNMTYSWNDGSGTVLCYITLGS